MLKRIRTLSRNQSALGRKPFLLKICFLSCLLVLVSESLLSDLITACTLSGTGLELARLTQCVINGGTGGRVEIPDLPLTLCDLRPVSTAPIHKAGIQGPKTT